MPGHLSPAYMYMPIALKVHDHLMELTSGEIGNLLCKKKKIAPDRVSEAFIMR